MEFYGYEQPLAMLFGSFFNPTSTQMLLQSMQQYGLALREDYYKNQEKLDNFIKEYGLFTSPIEKDQENFHNLTTGGLSDMFNDALKNGVDLLRSREGRSLVLRYIMSRPYGDLAKLKQSAESAKIYNLMAGELASKGLFSEDMAKAIDGDLSNWDTLSGNGIWSKTSPVQYKSIDDMLQSTLEDLRANGYDITDRSKPGIIRHSVSDASIDNALNKDVDDLMAMPQMKYFRDKLGMDNDQFRDYLHKHLRADLADKEETDDFYFRNESLKLEKNKFALDAQKTRAEIAKLNAEAAAKLNGKNQDGYSYNLTSFNTAMESRGFGGTIVYDEKGNATVLSPAEHENLAKISYQNNSVKNIVVFDKKTGKNVKFKDLSSNQQKELISRPGSKVRKAWLEAEKKFYLKTQNRLIANYIKNGGTYATASMAFASEDDANQWMSDISDYQIKKDDKGRSLGVDASYESMRKNLFTIGEVTSRSGQIRIGGAAWNKERFEENNKTKSTISYFKVANDGRQNGQIYQWESRDGLYHRYRRVEAYNDNDLHVGTYWLDCMSPNLINSTRGQGWDNRGIKGAGNNTKAVNSALDTVSLDS